MSTLLVAFHIDHQVDSIVELVTNDVPDQKLERLERLALASNQKASVVTFYFEDRTIEVIVV